MKEDDDSGDDFGEGCEKDMDAANTRKIAEKMNKDGYRIGKAKEEEVQMQIGFDAGFEEGISLGTSCGRLYGAARVASMQPTILSVPGRVDLLTELEKLLFETLPESTDEPEEFIPEIEKLILAISTDLSSQLEDFKSALRLRK